MCLAGPARAAPASDRIEDVADQAVAARGATDLVLAPIPSFSPTLGAGVAPAAILLYRPAGSPEPWTTGAVGLYTSNGSWAAGALHRMSLDGDRFRVSALGGYGSFNLKFYGIGDHSRREPLRIRQTGTLGVTDGLVRVAPDLHVGARARYLDLATTIRRSPRDSDVAIAARELKSRVVVIGPSFEYDRRDQPFAPTSGVFVAGRWLFGSDELGSDFTHNRLNLDANLYKSLGANDVLAVRAALCRASGSAPFFEVCQFGQSNDLRGYASGEHSAH